MQCNEALAETAVRAGCRFFAGYPITPQTSITEYLSQRMPQVGGEFMQAESELAASYMLLGASGVGARVMTATASQGISVMMEGLSVLNAQRFPGVVVDVTRGGAGNCGIEPSQSDYALLTRSIGHGGLKAYVLGPASVQETVDLMYGAFDFAEKYRCLVFILTDGMLGNLMEKVELPPMKPLPDNSAWAATGNRHHPSRMLGGIFTPDSATNEKNNREHDEMYKLWEREEVKVEEYLTEDADTVAVAWGSAARFAKGAVNALRAEGLKVGLIRPITLHPFPYESIRRLSPERVKNVIVFENAVPAQMFYDVEHVLDRAIPLHFYGRSAGTLVSCEEAEAELRRLAREG